MRLKKYSLEFSERIVYQMRVRFLYFHAHVRNT